MKRLLLIGTLFCTAAILGMGVGLFLPTDAGAGECHMEQPQYIAECPSASCPPQTPNAIWRCGTTVPGGAPCGCYLIGCGILCTTPL